ncbi:putative VQ motif-containing protein [Tripterygium wilfordii]|uniref:Putative VQ motif-containing protein n=1 Tax=Tripterygium wilfordii TaxID=458696 RepID=A0A7J7C284_TRIWF|nr:VQ motif-containing protein 1-like [Tripterygium wilfordii]KAF5728218.1 putative VQ motif-containing protein [Tripterygium wilfordii]
MSSNTKPVKVVIIDTKYVETDEGSFKSVVQKFTGKASTVTPSKAKKMKKKIPAQSSFSSSSNESVLIRDLSFKEFDRLFKEMPTLDELYDCRQD